MKKLNKDDDDDNEIMLTIWERVWSKKGRIGSNESMKHFNLKTKKSTGEMNG